MRSERGGGNFTMRMRDGHHQHNAGITDATKSSWESAASNIACRSTQGLQERLLSPYVRIQLSTPSGTVCFAPRRFFFHCSVFSNRSVNFLLCVLWIPTDAQIT